MPHSSVEPPPFPFLPSHLLPGPQVCFIASLYFIVFSARTLTSLGQPFQFPVSQERCLLLKDASDFGGEEVKESHVLTFWVSCLFTVDSQHLEDTLAHRKHSCGYGMDKRALAFILRALGTHERFLRNVWDFFLGWYGRPMREKVRG